MTPEKMKKLKAMGWSCGSAADLANLTPHELDEIDRKIALGAQIKAARLKQGLTQVQAAKLIGTSQPRIVDMEHGRGSISYELMFRSLRALGESWEIIANAIRNEERPQAQV